MTLKQALQDAVNTLASSDSARLDAELLLCHVLGQSRSYLFTWPDRALTPEQAASFAKLIEQRQLGKPVAHLLGYREFWTLKLAVTPDTLIPRPETELLVELALERLPKPNAMILDLGTGTGAIALALASERPQAQVWACDQSVAALEIAILNAHTHQLTNVQFLASSWFSAIPQQRFDLIVSNPPYIAQDDVHLSQGDVRFEPLSALAAGVQGLDDLIMIVKQASEYLASDGWLLLEHGYDQGLAVRELLQQAGFSAVQTYQDLAGHDRVSLGRYSYESA